MTWGPKRLLLLEKQQPTPVICDFPTKTQKPREWRFSEEILATLLLLGVSMRAVNRLTHSPHERSFTAIDRHTLTSSTTRGSTSCWAKLFQDDRGP